MERRENVQLFQVIMLGANMVTNLESRNKYKTIHILHISPHQRTLSKLIVANILNYNYLSGKGGEGDSVPTTPELLHTMATRNVSTPLGRDCTQALTPHHVPGGRAHRAMDKERGRKRE